MNNNLEIIKKKLLNKNTSSVIIDEEWGVGKTYELLKIKEELQNDNEYKDLNVIYLKIADLQNIGIREHCFLDFCSKSKNINSLKNLFKNLKGDAVNISLNLLNSLHEKNIKEHSLNDYLIIIDEIERIPNDMDIKFIFNQIFELKESKENVKLLISLCSKEFDFESKVVFEKWKDKISDHDITFSYLGIDYFSEKLKNEIGDITNIYYTEEFAELFNLYNIKNTRLIIKFKNIIIEKIKEKYSKELIPSNFYISKPDLYLFIKNEFFKFFNINKKIDTFQVVSHIMFKNDITFDLKSIKKTIKEINKSKNNFLISKLQSDILNYAGNNDLFINVFWMHNNVINEKLLIKENKDVVNSLSSLIEYNSFFEIPFIRKILEHNRILFLKNINNINLKAIDFKMVSDIFHKYILYFDLKEQVDNIEAETPYFAEIEKMLLFKKNEFIKYIKNIEINNKINKESLNNDNDFLSFVYLKFIQFGFNQKKLIDFLSKEFLNNLKENENFKYKLYKYKEKSKIILHPMYIDSINASKNEKETLIENFPWIFTEDYFKKPIYDLEVKSNLLEENYTLIETSELWEGYSGIVLYQNMFLLTIKAIDSAFDEYNDFSFKKLKDTPFKSFIIC